MKIYNGDLRDTTNQKNDSFLQINSCGIHLPSGSQVIVSRKKGRLDYQLMYIMTGKCKVEYDGNTTVLSHGFVLYPPDMPQLYMDYKDTKRIWLHFTGDKIDDLLKDAHLTCGVHPTGQSPIIEDMLLQLIIEFNQKANISTGKGLLLYIIYELGKLANNIDTNNDKVSKAITYITTHYNKDISINELANSCGLSERQFMHLFKEQVGMPPHAYQQTLRIQNCKVLLTSTQLSVAEISEQAGYNDPLYFSRIFKKRVGVSPKVYRAQNKVG
ncbi:MAG: helix-turn-helix transcriptional regulator [Tyzzerella sp.]|nr:helix-turn-helix transcriptional regulator [Tyzzerella sp.]